MSNRTLFSYVTIMTLVFLSVILMKAVDTQVEHKYILLELCYDNNITVPTVFDDDINTIKLERLKETL